eukprot:403336300
MFMKQHQNFSNQHLLNIFSYQYKLLEPSPQNSFSRCNICQSQPSSNDQCFHCTSCQMTFCLICYQQLSIKTEKNQQDNRVKIVKEQSQIMQQTSFKKKFEEDEQFKYSIDKYMSPSKFSNESESALKSGFIRANGNLINNLDEICSMETTPEKLISFNKYQSKIYSPTQKLINTYTVEIDISKAHSFQKCLNKKCKLNADFLSDNSLNLDPNDILFIRNIQAKKAFDIVDELQFFCYQCQQNCEKSKLVQHYKSECAEAEGIECSSKPYCRAVGTRGFIQQHELTCPYMKIQCERCDSTVIRKVQHNHSCFDTLFNRVNKLDHTHSYSVSRHKQQFQCKNKYEHVIQNCKKKMISLNKRLDNVIFTLNPNDNPHHMKVYQYVDVKLNQESNLQACKICKECPGWFICRGKCKGSMCSQQNCRKTCYKCVQYGKVFCRQCIQFCRDCWFWHCEECKCACDLNLS